MTLDDLLGHLGAGDVCPHGDPTCPCPDGLACHYEDIPGSPAMPCGHCKAHDFVPCPCHERCEACATCGNPHGAALLTLEYRSGDHDTRQEGA